MTLSNGSPPILTDSATLTGGTETRGRSPSPLRPRGVLPVDTESVDREQQRDLHHANRHTLPTTGTVTGTYQWVASYSGDPNNNGVASASGNEPVAVAPDNLLVSTTTNPTQVTVATAPFNDSATLSAGFNPSGTITFTLYAPDGTTAVYTNDVVVTGNGTYGTATSGDNPGGYTPLVTGTYQWVASYSGDGNNNSVTSNPGDEPVIARTVSSILTTSALPANFSGGWALTGADGFSNADRRHQPHRYDHLEIFAPGVVLPVDTEIVPVAETEPTTRPSATRCRRQVR